MKGLKEALSCLGWCFGSGGFDSSQTLPTGGAELGIKKDIYTTKLGWSFG